MNTLVSDEDNDNMLFATEEMILSNQEDITILQNSRKHEPIKNVKLYWINEFLELPSKDWLKELSEFHIIGVEIITKEKVTDDILEHIMNAIVCWPHLKNFNFQISRDDEIKSEGLNSFAEKLREIQKLKSLSLNFFEFYYISYESMKNLINVIGSIEVLNRISFKFEGCKKLRDAGLENILVFIKKLEYLRDLSMSFNFEYCPWICDDALKEIAIALNTAPMLNSLRLAFLGCVSLNESRIKDFAEGLMKINSLSVLNLEIEGHSSIGNEGITYIADAIKKLTSLKEIYLTFNKCILINQEGYKSMFSSISSILSIKIIKLNFIRCVYLTDQTIEDMEILSSLSLKDFSLKVEKSYYVTDKCSQDLSKFLQKIKTLKDVDLVFENCKSMTSKGRKALHDIVDKYKNDEFQKFLRLISKK